MGTTTHVSFVRSLIKRNPTRGEDLSKAGDELAKKVEVALAVLWEGASETREQVLARARALTQNTKRDVEALHYRQSFSDEEFDSSSPEDVQRVNDLGYQLAKKMHPD